MEVNITQLTVKYKVKGYKRINQEPLRISFQKNCSLIKILRKVGQKGDNQICSVSQPYLTNQTKKK